MLLKVEENWSADSLIDVVYPVKATYICSLYYSIVLRAALYVILYYALQMEIGNAILLHMQIMLHIYIYSTILTYFLQKHLPWIQLFYNIGYGVSVIALLRALTMMLYFRYV
jgi:hypothetical protein